jgi:hypothetical protein
LSTSQKKEYQKPSKVTTSNLSDKIKPLEEFIAYDDDLKRTLLGNWVLKFGVEGLCKAWKYDKATIASYCYKYGVKRQLKQAEKERTEKETNQINNQVKAQAAIKEVIYQAGIPVDVPFFDCTTILKIIDTLPGEEVYSYMQNISKFLIANKNYKISIDIKELITNE